MNETCRQLVGVPIGGLARDARECGRPASRFVMDGPRIHTSVCPRHAVWFRRNGHQVTEFSLVVGFANPDGSGSGNWSEAE